MNIVMISS